MDRESSTIISYPGTLVPQGRRAELRNQLSDALSVILLQTDLLQDDHLTVDLAHETALEIRRSVQQMRSLLRYL